jgi:hypothetical protein
MCHRKGGKIERIIGFDDQFLGDEEPGKTSLGDPFDVTEPTRCDRA